MASGSEETTNLRVTEHCESLPLNDLNRLSTPTAGKGRAFRMVLITMPPFLHVRTKHGRQHMLQLLDTVRCFWKLQLHMIYYRVGSNSTNKIQLYTNYSIVITVQRKGSTAGVIGNTVFGDSRGDGRDTPLTQRR